jgi:outer membrane protein assembly factor BamB
MSILSRREVLKAGAALCAAPLAVKASALQPESLRFVYFSDTHVTLNRNLAECLAMLEEMNALRPALGINGGDVTDYGWRSEYERYAQFQREAQFELHHAAGNHDVRWSPLGIPLFEELFGQSFGAFEKGGCLFVVLDSTVPLSHWGSYAQPQLTWLEQRLADAGREIPVFITTHHWVGRDDLRVDNELELYRIIEPYNVKMIMNGHGHSDLLWDWMGVPGVMNKGLYQGSWMQFVVDRAKGEISASRRTVEAPQLTDFWTGKIAPDRAKRRVWAVGRRQANAGELIKAPSGALSAAWNKTTPAVLAAGAVAAKGITAGEHQLYWRMPGGRVEVDNVEIVDAENLLQPAWRTQLSGGVLSHLEADQDTVYASTLSGDVFALRQETGGVLWRAELGGFCHSSPVAVGSQVLIGSSTGEMHSLDRRSGLAAWKGKTGGPIYASAAVAQGIAACASGDGQVRGWDAATGQLRWEWQQPKSETGFSQSKAATDGRRFYIGGWDNMLYCLNASTGKLEWKMPCCGDMSFHYSPAIGSPAVGNGMVYVPANGNKLYAFDLATGAEKWVFASPGEKVGYSSPRLNGRRLFIGCLGDTGQVRCIDAMTGKEIWMAQTGSTIYDSSPALSGRWLAILSVDGTLSLITQADGRVASQHRLPPGLGLCTPVAHDGRIFASSLSGALLAFDTPE